MKIASGVADPGGIDPDPAVEEKTDDLVSTKLNPH